MASIKSGEGEGQKRELKELLIPLHGCMRQLKRGHNPYITQGCEVGSLTTIFA